MSGSRKSFTVLLRKDPLFLVNRGFLPVSLSVLARPQFHKTEQLFAGHLTLPTSSVCSGTRIHGGDLRET